MGKNIEHRQQEERQFLHQSFHPSEPARLHQFHQHKAVERNNHHIQRRRKIPRMLVVKTINLKENHVLYQLQGDHNHEPHNHPKEHLLSFSPKQESHHGEEHHAHTINKTRYRIHVYFLYK